MLLPLFQHICAYFLVFNAARGHCCCCSTRVNRLVKPSRLSSTMPTPTASSRAVMPGAPLTLHTAPITAATMETATRSTSASSADVCSLLCCKNAFNLAASEALCCCCCCCSLSAAAAAAAAAATATAAAALAWLFEGLISGSGGNFGVLLLGAAAIPAAAAAVLLRAVLLLLPPLEGSRELSKLLFRRCAGRLLLL
jgi:hypothetical protein